MPTTVEGAEAGNIAEGTEARRIANEKDLHVRRIAEEKDLNVLQRRKQ